ncbi:hypothetical protein [Nostoc sp.]
MASLKTEQKFHLINLGSVVIDAIAIWKQPEAIAYLFFLVPMRSLGAT